MSNILTKTVKKTTLLSIILAVILAAAIALGIVGGLNNWGVFNKDAVLKGNSTVTVSMNTDGQVFRLDDIEAACETVFKANGEKPTHVFNGTKGMNGELLYVFNGDVDLAALETALEKKFEGLVANEWKDHIVQVTVSTNTQTSVSFLAQYFVLRGVLAGLALATLVFVYMVLRNGLEKGIAAGVSTALGVLLTTALLILTRIPVTASVAYVIGAAGLLSAAISTISLNKIRTAEKAENAQGVPADELVCSALATHDVTLLAVLGSVSIILMGAIATEGVRWFALAALIALVASVFVGFLYTPALYIPLKKAADNRPEKDAYVGAKKTSKKQKKVAEVAPSVVATVAEVEAIPVKEVSVEEPLVEEVAVEEPVVEEVPVEEAPVEEPTVEEAPAEEPVAEEAPVETAENDAE